MQEIDKHSCGTCYYFREESPDGQTQFSIGSDYGVCGLYNSPKGLITDQRVTPRQTLMSHDRPEIITLLAKNNSTCHTFAGPIIKFVTEGSDSASVGQDESLHIGLTSHVLN